MGDTRKFSREGHGPVFNQNLSFAQVESGIFKLQGSGIRRPDADAHVCKFYGYRAQVCYIWSQLIPPLNKAATDPKNWIRDPVGSDLDLDPLTHETFSIN